MREILFTQYLWGLPTANRYLECAEKGAVMWELQVLLMEAYRGMLHAALGMRVGFPEGVTISGKTWRCGIGKVMGGHLSASYIFV